AAEGLAQSGLILAVGLGHKDNARRAAAGVELEWFGRDVHELALRWRLARHIRVSWALLWHRQFVSIGEVFLLDEAVLARPIHQYIVPIYPLQHAIQRENCHPRWIAQVPYRSAR